LFVPIIRLNIILGVFNLLPIHPLDGFKIVGGVLTEEKTRDWYSLQRYGIFFLLLLIIPLGGSSMLQTILEPVINIIYKLLIPFSSSSGII
jgi:Zn-dependent protease